jgi:hypothetical protein
MVAKKNTTNQKMVEVTITVPADDYEVASLLAKAKRTSPKHYFSNSATESLVVDAEEHYGKDSPVYKAILRKLGS